MGANGSGKSTLCSIMRGFAPSFHKGELSGDVAVNGKPIAHYSDGELSQLIGFLFQNPFNQLSGVKETVFEEVAFGLENLGIATSEIIDRVTAALTQTKTTAFANRNPLTLSNGQLQRVALAAVLVMNPQILILDEPTSQLDPNSSIEIFDVLAAIEATIIVTEHKTRLIADAVDEVIILDNGKLAVSGKPSDLLYNPSVRKYGVKPVAPKGEI